MKKLLIRKIASILCALMVYLWSGVSNVLIAMVQADDLQTKFNNQRQVVRNLELAATKAMYAATPVCDDFDTKFNVLMAVAGKKLPDIAAELIGAEVEKANIGSTQLKSDSIPLNPFRLSFVQKETDDSSPTPRFFATPSNTGNSFMANYMGIKNIPNLQGNSKSQQDKLGDATIKVTTLTNVTAKSLGLPAEIADIIDKDPSLVQMLAEANSAALLCKPLYGPLLDAEAAVSVAVNEWIELADMMDPNATLGHRVEANGMWVAISARRAAHIDMHTSNPVLAQESSCAGDIFTMQSIPNLFQGLATGNAPLVAQSEGELLRQSQCINVEQSIAADKGIAWGAAAAILVFGKPEDVTLRKRLLEASIIAGAPILETTKVLGPTGLWVLMQSLLVKETSSPEIWVLDKESYLVNYGITTMAPNTGLAVTYPICPDTPPVATTPPAPKWDATVGNPDVQGIGKTLLQTPQSIVQQMFNPPTDQETLPEIVAVDPQEAPLAYGYTIKTLKDQICPVDPSQIISAPVFIDDTQLAKGLLSKQCYKADVITDSYRGDHMGYATCSLPETIAGGRVCKRQLCGSTPPQGLDLGGRGGDPSMPTPSMGGGNCGFPAFYGTPNVCNLTGGGTASLYVHQGDNSGCGKVRQLGFVAYEDGDFEEVVIDVELPKSDNSNEPEKPTFVDDGKATSPEKKEDQPKQDAAKSGPDKSSSYYLEVPVQAPDLKPKPLPLLPIPPPGDTPSLPGKKPDITTPAQYAAALNRRETLEKVETQLAWKQEACYHNCEDILSKLKAVRKELLKLEWSILTAEFDHAAPINNQWDLHWALRTLRDIESNCEKSICAKKASDLKKRIKDSNVFKKFVASVKKDAKNVLKNKNFKDIFKKARETLLGKTIDDEKYDLCYNGMLSLLDSSTAADLSVPAGPLGRLGATSPDGRDVDIYLLNVATTFTSLSDFYDQAVNTVIHEQGEHVVSILLQNQGYEFSDGMDHQLGVEVQRLSGVAMGYTSAPIRITVGIIALEGGGSAETRFRERDFSGYKKYLPGGWGVVEKKSANNSPKRSSGGGSGGGSGAQKDCPPEGCGGLINPCQLATMAANAQCDMSMGKPALSLIPNKGGLIPPTDKLPKSVSDWMACLFPDQATGYDHTDVFCDYVLGQILCTSNTYHVPGKANDDCKTTACDEQNGFYPTKDKTTGVCSCKLGGSGVGDPSEAYMGTDFCKAVVCTGDTMNSCCQGSRGMQQGGQSYHKSDNTKRVPQQGFQNRSYQTYPPNNTRGRRP